MPNQQESPNPSRRVVALGEVLWDILPAGPRLGGAAANFCVMSGRLGSTAVLASRVGVDSLGERVIDSLRAYPVDISFVQRDTDLPTGSVTVTVDPGGQPSYCIHEDVAWDRFDFTPSWAALAGGADAVCFSTLAQRSALSRAAIQAFLLATRESCMRVLDVNLRFPFVSEESIRWSLSQASVLKVNDDELKTICDLLHLRTRPSVDDWRASVDTLMSAFPLGLVCLTFGASGSLLVSTQGHYRHPGVPTKVLDTVGAGDAFLATVTHYALQDATLAEISEAANRNGAWVASQSAAIPEKWPPSDEAIGHGPEQRGTEA
jgi:fructokinase